MCMCMCMCMYLAGSTFRLTHTVWFHEWIHMLEDGPH